MLNAVTIRSWCLGLAACLLLPLSLFGDEIAPADQRFKAADTAEVPDFQRHVVPLLGRLGCNGRSCHGSFQGRGGLRLSLFGYDFEMDHDSLTAPASAGIQNRIDRQKPAESLIIQKPTFQIDHEGGERFRVDSWEHHLLQCWIRAGAEGVSKPRELSHLEMEPAEVVFGSSPQPVQLRVVAVWDNGEREDVTPLCRFRTNDEAVVTADEDGRTDLGRQRRYSRDCVLRQRCEFSSCHAAG